MSKIGIFPSRFVSSDRKRQIPLKSQHRTKIIFKSENEIVGDEEY